MNESERIDRLEAERARLDALKEDSTIFDFESIGEPPAKYVISFRGQGINRSLSGSKIENIDLHRIELRIPYAFPGSPPDIRWLSPIFHPNISFSGLVKLRDIGLPWEEDLSLDIICERLWDLARLAYFDEERATNYSARNWVEDQDEVRLPVDHRPLRDKSIPISSNVVKYQRRGVGAVRLAARADEADDVFYIGEDTPAPAVPKRRGGDDDVMYIGYE